MFCVKLILWSIVAQKGTNILIFYIFEYGAEYGAESGALEIANQNNLLAIAFPPFRNGVFGFFTDLCATIMLQTMRNFINKNSNSSLKIIRQIKTFTRIMMANNLSDYFCTGFYNLV